MWPRVIDIYFPLLNETNPEGHCISNDKEKHTAEYFKDEAWRFVNKRAKELGLMD
jgi:hypothetical protein